ncbi:type I restriction enzyme HsdR N-terminal domain-containing protein [Myxococcota bacterium]|nr:type I restriction enzyme HsdR N-terminal domain-containing protein [Myxococcota bacterium]
MLFQEIKRCNHLIKEYKGQQITEQDTKNAIIEPILASLGWPKQDLTRVRAEYRHTAGDNPVDYALFDEGTPQVFLEAKALDKDLDDRKSTLQTIHYANAANVEWALLTNGARWILYAVFERRDLAERKVFDVTLDDPNVEDWLGLILPARVKEGRLRRVRALLSAEAQVHATLRTLIDARDDGLIELLAKRTGLESSAIATALGALKVHVERAALREVVRVADRASAEARAPQAAPPASSPSLSAASAAPTGRALGVPPVGIKPKRLWLNNQSWEVNSWKDLLIKGLEAIARQKPTDFDHLFDTSTFKGRKRLHLSRDSDGMISPKPVNGGYVESNQSAASIIILMNRVLSKIAPEISARWE